MYGVIYLRLFMLLPAVHLCDDLQSTVMIIVSAAKAACMLQIGIDVFIICLNSHILTLEMNLFYILNYMDDIL